MPEISDQLQKLQESVDALRDEVRSLGQRIPRWLLQTTQQIEYLDILYRQLRVDRGYLPPTRGWAASPDFLVRMASHFLRTQPDVVVECGCGVSTLVTARCLQLNGHGKVFSLEDNENHLGRVRTQLLERGLSSHAEVIHCRLKPYSFPGAECSWYDLEGFRVQDIQCLVIDGPVVGPNNPLARYPAGPMLFPRLTDDATVFLDDFNRPSEQIAVRRWRDEYPAMAVSREATEKGCARLRFVERTPGRG